MTISESLRRVAAGGSWAFVASSASNPYPLLLLSSTMSGDRLGRAPGPSPPDVVVFTDAYKRPNLQRDGGNARLVTLRQPRRIGPAGHEVVYSRVRVAALGDGGPAVDVDIIVVRGDNHDVYSQCVEGAGPPQTLVAVNDGCRAFGGQEKVQGGHGCENVLRAPDGGLTRQWPSAPRWLVTDHLTHAVGPHGEVLCGRGDAQIALAEGDVVVSQDADFPYQMRACALLERGQRRIDGEYRGWGWMEPFGGAWLFRVERRRSIHPVAPPEADGRLVFPGPWLPFAPAARGRPAA